MILAIVIILLVLAGIAWYESKEWGAAVGVLAIGGFVGFLVTVLMMCFTGGRVYMEYPLVTMQDGKTTHGSFFLGSGNIDGVASFTWYEKDGGSYYLEDIPAWQAEVRYTTGQPHVIWDCRNERAGWVFYPLNVSPDPYCSGRSTHVTFYVPEGSVKNEYVLDAK